MKHIVKSIVVGATLLFGSTVSYAAQIDNVSLGPISARGATSTQIGFNVSFESQSLGCQSGGWWGIIPDDDPNAKSMLAVALTALAAGKTVSVIAGECAEGGTHVRIESIWLYD